MLNDHFHQKLMTMSEISITTLVAASLAESFQTRAAILAYAEVTLNKKESEAFNNKRTEFYKKIATGFLERNPEFLNDGSTPEDLFGFK